MPLQIWPISCPKAALESSGHGRVLRVAWKEIPAASRPLCPPPWLLMEWPGADGPQIQDCKKALPPEGALGDFSHSVNTPVAAGTHHGLRGEPPLCCSYKSPNF